MARIFALGDLHGCNEAFHRMLFDKIKIEKTDKIYCMGDYIDRGLQSKEVVDTIISLREQGFFIHTLRGNHEQMMIDSDDSNEHFEHWFNNGGDTTLNSFGIEKFAEMPVKYRQFFLNTKFCISTANYIFVHAGLNFMREDIFEDKDAMLWIRQFKPDQPALKNKILVHGHTPKPLEEILLQTGNCINIDGGCVYNQNMIYGNLVAISLPGKEFIVERN
ncbi:MAG: metallophosphoesterase family protein [Chitinophagaceae bacterium]